MGTHTNFLSHKLGRRTLLSQLGVAAVAFSLGGALQGCGKPQKPKAKIKPTGEELRLSFYNWQTYTGETTIADFEAVGGAKVTMRTFATNDELVEKLRAGNAGFDVIVPSDDAVERLIRTQLLEPLDHALIPNFANIAPEFRDVSYDPDRCFSMPYFWLVLGIGYRKSKVKPAPDSWKPLFDSAQYKGRISLLSEAADLFRLYGRYLGYALNDVTPEVVAKIEPMLTAQKAFLKSFHEDNGQELLASGEVDLVLEYNGDIAQVMRDDEDIGFVIPKEGSQINADNLAIPKGAPHPKNAHAFINFLLDGEVGKSIAESILYPTPNAAAKDLMPKSYRDDPVIFPPASDMERCSYAAYSEEMQPIFEDAFTRIRAA